MPDVRYPPHAPTLPPRFWEDLANRNRLGLDLSARQAKDWFYLVAWPSYSARGYKRHRSMIARWWGGVTVSELGAAASARARIERGARLTIATAPIRANEKPVERGQREQRGLVPLDDIFAAFANRRAK